MKKYVGQCKFEDCLMDAVSDGYCKTHMKDTSCDHCGFEYYEHILTPSLLICPTSIYKMKS